MVVSKRFRYELKFFVFFSGISLPINGYLGDLKIQVLSSHSAFWVRMASRLSSMWLFVADLLTLKDLFISESCIEIKIELSFYFHTSLWCLERFYEGL